MYLAPIFLRPPVSLFRVARAHASAIFVPNPLFSQLASMCSG